jgi:DNA-binding CsgD family transcriptional regulator
MPLNMQLFDTSSFDLDPRDRVALFAFSDELQLLYLNERAETLTHERSELAIAASGVVPAEVLTAATKLQRPTQPSWRRQVYLQDNVRYGETPWQLKGFVIPTDPLSGASLIVVLMEPAASGIPRCDHLGLTPRECAIAELVVRGLTNKEIASELSLAEQTVKDHMKRIMMKTETSTRAALVAYIFTQGQGARPEPLTESTTGGNLEIC